MRRTFHFLVAFAPAVHGFTTFETSCTKPNSTINYISPPNIRGTLNILWSCLFAIISCAWIIQHLNVPEQRNGRDPGWRGDIKWQLRRSWTTLKWMLITIIASEIPLSKAVAELNAARCNHDDIEIIADVDGVAWSLTHSLFANMGGFVIRAQKDAGIALSEEMEMASSGETSGSSEASLEKTENLDMIHVTVMDLILLRQAGKLDKLPSISLEEINDKSKPDTLITTIAIVQVFWITSSILARTYHHLPISQLEITTIAFCVSSIFTYFFNFHKPRNITLPITITHLPQSTLRPLTTTLSDEKCSILNLRLPWWPKEKYHLSPHPNGSPIPNDIIIIHPRDNEAIFEYCLHSTLFGFLNVIAFEFHFPTAIDKGIWKFSTFLILDRYFFIMCVKLFETVGAFLIRRFCGGRGREFLRGVCSWMMFGLDLGYVIARACIWAVVFRTLFALPTGVFEETWVGSVPHVG